MYVWAWQSLFTGPKASGKMYRPERGKRRAVTSPLIQVFSISLPENVSKPGGQAFQSTKLTLVPKACLKCYQNGFTFF
jgi:hypothetical protein